ncbi:MAG: filamentous hemagglutinin N-terminal domain-containing protein [Calothrix sp. MO_192.B10]|nr:filamentous hemagglutinin N-terminal domain-containing protein [Calothrix sp. MO_192.B10]
MINNQTTIKSPRQYFYHIGLIIGVILGSFSAMPPATAQISADTTLPNGQTIVLPGATKGLNFLIQGGTKAGNNLFHSFKEFSVPTNGSVIFQNKSNLANIINRVTGTSLSNIDGLIQTTGNANFFLLNPNGIIFGPNASLNIGGSFIGSTASSMKLDNGDEFSATNPTQPLLSVSVPLGLQFGNNTASIINKSQFNGKGKALNSVRAPAGLQGKPFKTLALIGGEVKADTGNITVPGGRLELGSVDKNSFVRLEADDPQGFAFDYKNVQGFGDIQLSRSVLDVSGPGGGNIQLQGKTVNVNQSGIFAVTSPNGMKNGGEITLRGEQLNINSSNIQEITFGSVQGGDVNLEAKKIAIQAQSVVSAETWNVGKGGNLTIRADDLKLAESFAGTEAKGDGNAGDVSIDSQNLTVQDGAQIIANTLGQGDAGKLTVKAHNSINLVGEGIKSSLSSGLFAKKQGSGKSGGITIETEKLQIRDGARISTFTVGSGDGVQIVIQAQEAELRGTSQTGKPSGIFSPVEAGATGKGGSISFTTGTLRISDGAQISATTFGKGNAGRISIVAPQSVEIRSKNTDTQFSGLFAQVERKQGTSPTTGNGGNVFLDTGQLIMQGTKARISASTGDLGTGGNITINAKDVLVEDGAQIQAATKGLTNAGKIEVTADTIQLIGENGTASALVTSTQGDAAAGSLTVNTKNLFIEDGGRISASTSGMGAGGELNLNATEIKLIGTKGEFASGLFTETQGLGDAGELNINTDKLLVTNGARVSADTFGGLGGSINLIANSLEVSNGGQFRTNTASNSNAGNITMQVRDSILLTGTDSGIFASTTADSQGNGGKIDIDPISFIIRDGATIAVDSQGMGIGGDIKLVADSLTLDGGKISAETRSNTGGNINLQLQDLLLLRNSSQISTSAGNQQFGGDGGNITISSPFIVAPPIENSDITANAFTGRGGNIQINTDSILGISFSNDLTNLSNITASSTFGVSGVVDINSPEVDPSKGLPELPENTTDASKLIAQGCSASPGQVASRFMVKGKGGLAPSPEDIFSGDRILQDLQTTPIKTQQNLAQATISPTNISRPRHALVEAQAMVVNARGEIVLTAQAPKVKSRSSWVSTTNCQGEFRMSEFRMSESSFPLHR